MERRLALDHITVVDADPPALARIARAVGCDGMCLFMEPMDVLPLMPPFDLYGDRAQRRVLRETLAGQGVELDLVYPFTIAGRTEIATFARTMECAAELGAKLLNVLVYDRDQGRRTDKFGEFCNLARSHALRVAIEFYPVSQVRNLTQALELVSLIDRADEVGVNVDLLHLMRSGGSIRELAAAPREYILYGQVCDGPSSRPEKELDFEASSDRLLPGDGVFDVAGFVAALPRECPISVEVPRNGCVAGTSPLERARAAVSAARGLMAEQQSPAMPG